MIRFGIIGCGSIGHKRALAIRDTNATLVGCADLIPEKAQEFASTHSCLSYNNYSVLLRDEDIDAVIIATPHNSLSNLTLTALESGKHVLVEKPGAVSSHQLHRIRQLLSECNLKYRVGYNHRFHRSVIKCTELISSSTIGELMFLRARYGHGGRVGYDREWRSSVEISGGGELIDQGSHLIDLASLWLGELTKICGVTHTYFWDMEVDDNAFLTLETLDHKVAHIHVSCTEWKNLFSIEIYGKKGKIELTGLGGSYGTERISLYLMKPEMGPPETQIWEYPMADQSWTLELSEFLKDIEEDRESVPGIANAMSVLSVIDDIYSPSSVTYTQD